MKVNISTRTNENDNYGLLEVTLDGVIDNTVYHQVIVAIENNLKILINKRQEKYFNCIIDTRDAITIEKIVRNKLVKLLSAKELSLRGNKVAVVSDSPLLRSYFRIIIKRAKFDKIRLFYELNEAEDWILKKET